MCVSKQSITLGNSYMYFLGEQIARGSSAYPSSSCIMNASSKQHVKASFNGRHQYNWVRYWDCPLTESLSLSKPLQLMSAHDYYLLIVYHNYQTGTIDIVHKKYSEKIIIMTLKFKLGYCTH